MAYGTAKIQSRRDCRVEENIPEEDIGGDLIEEKKERRGGDIYYIYSLSYIDSFTILSYLEPVTVQRSFVSVPVQCKFMFRFKHTTNNFS